jgi:hypothetical protein
MYLPFCFVYHKWGDQIGKLIFILSTILTLFKYTLIQFEPSQLLTFTVNQKMRFFHVAGCPGCSVFLTVTIKENQYADINQAKVFFSSCRW